MATEKRSPKGRGSHVQPANRFERIHAEADWEQVADDEEFLAAQGRVQTEYLPDRSQSIVSENDSPDIAFRYSVNPYRGCAHGCAYCYARPTHEYLGWSAGLDFESKILVKHDAPRLLRQFLARPRWSAELIVFSGVTDCYQPCERQFRLTRQCLEVAWEARQPVGIITKNALLLRDLDLLQPMAAARLVDVSLSITTLDAELARTLEPRTSTPAARLKAVRALADAGIPVRVMTAPIIPGLNDCEIPALLAAAAEAGAHSAAYQLLRLPLTVKPVFLEWLERTRPDSKQRIEQLIRSSRGGALSSSEFGKRMKGEGAIAEQVKQMFRTFARKHGLNRKMPELDHAQFRPPILPGAQQTLF
jgi:DNA repair photolyase